jgi:hypothetical protein
MRRDRPSIAALPVQRRIGTLGMLHVELSGRKPLGRSQRVIYRRAMKHITFADKSLLADDEAVDLLLEYARLLADQVRADTVTLNCVSADGNEVEATFLLEPGAPLMSETTNSTMTAPDNSDAIAYMRQRIMLLTSPPPVLPQDETMPDSYEDLHL